ncbi:hypothetical protein [Phocaeicola sp.]|uniref:hypothetical protein n=1 Tax=Phocaeicola sp. TaxID=2773926 RepID=UPI00386494AC
MNSCILYSPSLSVQPAALVMQTAMSAVQPTTSDEAWILWWEEMQGVVWSFVFKYECRECGPLLPSFLK